MSSNRKTSEAPVVGDFILRNHQSLKLDTLKGDFPFGKTGYVAGLFRTKVRNG
ncbi:hypothetical protein H8E77_05935 [bacterium]|nr:hypothetical protein [bacterium]